MLASIRTAYHAGWRAGRTSPAIEVVNGHKYLKQPQCPFRPRQFLKLFAWQEGYHNGLYKRLNDRRVF